MCWHSLFPHSVIAYNFPIRSRTQGIGVEISFETMIQLSGVDRPIEHYGNLILLGISNALVPTAILGEDSLQWHLVTSYHEDGIALRNIPRTSVIPVQNVLQEDISYQEFFELMQKKRHFLGWCRQVKVTLGCSPANGGDYSNLDYTSAREDLRTRALTSVNTTVGSSGAGFFGGTVGGTWTVYSNRTHPSEGYHERFELLLSTVRRLPLVLFNPSEQRGWLVPALSVILHMVHVRVLEDSYSADLPYADACWDRGGAAFKAIYDNRDLPVGPQNPEKPYTLRDIVEEFWYALKRLRGKRARRNYLNMKTILYGHELMDLVHRTGPVRLKRIEIGDTGGWSSLTNDIDLTLFCTEFGDVIAPMECPCGLCPFWASVPRHMGILCATVLCLKYLSRCAVGNENCEYLMNRWKWHCPESFLIPASVKVNKTAVVCNRLLTLVVLGVLPPLDRQTLLQKKAVSSSVN